jgi:N-acetylglucosaminyl-diphospho-decaprenol L-rhamnosyltransferase
VDLATVIVTWNVRDLVLDALRTLHVDVDAHGPAAETWVVDNASADGTVEAIRQFFPQVHVIASETNRGFAGGNNLALRTLGFDPAVSGQPDSLPRAVFLLNPDTLVHVQAVRTLYDALFAASNNGLVGARLTYGDGSFQHSAFEFPGIWQTVIDLLPMPGRLRESRLNGRYPRHLYEGQEPFPVGHVLGATMMVRRECIRQVGLFDEQFFLYCEEVDWAMRIHQRGWQVLCVPQAHVTHLEGRSAAQVRPESIQNLWRSRFKLYEKHYGPLKVALIRRIVRLGMRRKIHQARQDRSLSGAQREALMAAYQAVAAL